MLSILRRRGRLRVLGRVSLLRRLLHLTLRAGRLRLLLRRDLLRRQRLRRGKLLLRLM